MIAHVTHPWGEVIGAWCEAGLRYRGVVRTKVGTALAGESVGFAPDRIRSERIDDDGPRPKLGLSSEDLDLRFGLWLGRVLAWELTPEDCFHPLIYGNALAWAHALSHLTEQQVARLTPWERSFVESIPATYDRYGGFTPKQTDHLKRIIDKIARLEIGLPARRYR